MRCAESPRISRRANCFRRVSSVGAGHLSPRGFWMRGAHKPAVALIMTAQRRLTTSSSPRAFMKQYTCIYSRTPHHSVYAWSRRRDATMPWLFCACTQDRLSIKECPYTINIIVCHNCIMLCIAQNIIDPPKSSTAVSEDWIKEANY